MQEDFLNNSISLAAKIEDQFKVIGKKIRGGGVKQAPYMVLHKAYMPRVLIETGFVSNPVEGAILDSEEGQNKIANAIAEAIISYKKEYFGNGDGYAEEDRPSKKIVEKPTTDTAAPPKKEAVKEEVEVKKDNKKEKQNELDNASGIQFKIQIGASKKKMDLVPKNFKGLKNIEMDDSSSMIKYFYGKTSDYEEAKKFLDETKSKGYDSAFIIALKNGKLIPLKDAVK
jgi:N-acetylmuramoyl-L-alanine amidase